MDSQAFSDLKDSTSYWESFKLLEISLLKGEKESLIYEIQTDKKELNNLSKEISEIQLKIDYHSNIVKNQEAVIREYDQILSESLKAYDKVNQMIYYNIKKNLACAQ